MMHKTWNVRDQTKEALQELLLRKYREIEGEYKMLKKVSKIEDAKKLIDEIWAMKALANTIEMELMRREYNNGTAS
jgi:adenine C2-methylase RlmN of 23S rRNA A2503 and tRNA A37